MKSKIGLFEAFGIEIELMIVDRNSLDVRPIADQLLADAASEPLHATSSLLTKSPDAALPDSDLSISTATSAISDFDDGIISWSNELVAHVIELKTTAPALSLDGLEDAFYKSQRHAAELLSKHGARLMPTGMHPWMNPHTETVLWPHDNNEIYSLYNTIFNCRGHGWSNLQSVHINLPFKNENEFKRLHSAIRLLLPILPALSASSPFTDSKFSGVKDNRLAHYETNQQRLPIIAGEVIPDSVTGFADYRSKISDPIQVAISPHDPEGLLKGDWLNSRGAIARIDRGTIEIRLLDTQECAHADLTLVQFIVSALQAFIIDDKILAAADQLDTTPLYKIWKACVTDAESALIDNTGYLNVLVESTQSPGTSRTQPTSAQSLWQKIFSEKIRPTLLRRKYPRGLIQAFEELLSRPSLATRILNAAGPNPSPKKLRQIYEKLCDCLDNNELFDSASIERSNSVRRTTSLAGQNHETHL